MRKTKIVCTLGPATRSADAISSMARAGMNVARMNFSHETYAEHKLAVETVKRVRQTLDMPIALLLDTRGPEIRLSEIPDGPVTLEVGSRYTLYADGRSGDKSGCGVNYAPMTGRLSRGDKVLINDGEVCLRVDSADNMSAVCTVVRGGAVSGKKSINLPGVDIDMPFLSETDMNDLLFGIEHGVEYVAASFVRTGSDIDMMRTFLDRNGGSKISIIAKIENALGIYNFDDILARSDGIMVARGDMGVEIPFERLPGIQKLSIQHCISASKPSITATQMLESMTEQAVPTRAEISDVANAVFDGTSSVMLSGETAVGAHPQLVVSTMASILCQAEADSHILRRPYCKDSRLAALCDAAVTLAEDCSAAAIIVLTSSGLTATTLSAHRPLAPIVAVTTSEITYNKLALIWGVTPLKDEGARGDSQLLSNAIARCKQMGIIAKGDSAVVIYGLDGDIGGKADVIRLITVE